MGRLMDGMKYEGKR